MTRSSRASRTLSKSSFMSSTIFLCWASMAPILTEYSAFQSKKGMGAPFLLAGLAVEVGVLAAQPAVGGLLLVDEAAEVGDAAQEVPDRGAVRGDARLALLREGGVDLGPEPGGQLLGLGAELDDLDLEDAHLAPG